jgi:hypothetical protein
MHGGGFAKLTIFYRLDQDPLADASHFYDPKLGNVLIGAEHWKKDYCKILTEMKRAYPDDLAVDQLR